MVLEMKLILYSNVRYVLWLYAVRTRYSIFCRYVCMFPVTLDFFDEYRSHKNTNKRLWTFVHRKKKHGHKTSHSAKGTDSSQGTKINTYSPI